MLEYLEIAVFLCLKHYNLSKWNILLSRNCCFMYLFTVFVCRLPPVSPVSPRFFCLKALVMCFVPCFHIVETLKSLLWRLNKKLFKLQFLPLFQPTPFVTISFSLKTSWICFFTLLNTNKMPIQCISSVLVWFISR